MNQPKSITDDAIVKATGKTWQQWFAILDKEGAVKLTHKEIVVLLLEKGLLKNNWWRQSVTVEYEKARGKRVVGETCDAGFQVGVQKSLPITADNLWALLTKPAGRAIWLGKLPRLRFTKGQN